MTNPTIPSRNPSSAGHLGGLLKVALRKTMESTDGQLPCKVLSYDRTTNRALVQPLISLVTTAGQPQPRAQIASVPVLALGGGGFCINFPLQAGDLGWIEASDRDISLFMQQMEQSKPNTFRIHRFSDGRFIPDAFRQYTFDTDDAANMVIQSFDGSVKIALGPGLINVNAPTVTVNSTASVVNTTTASIVALVSASIKAPSISLKNAGTALKTLLNSTLLTWLETHVHSNGNGGANTGVPTSAPGPETQTTVVEAE